MGSDEQKQISELEKELQIAKLDLQEANTALIAAQHDLNLQRQEQTETKNSEARNRIESLIHDLAGPLAQLVTQNHIQHVQGKALSTKDIDATLNRLVQKLKSHGLEMSEEVGSTSLFDPNIHEPINLDDTIEIGEEVLIRMCSIGYEGKILRRAAVSRLSKP
jgi:molecular chaperone GrpE (heat shock protein)